MLVDAYTAYTNSRNVQPEVADKYEAVIALMKKYFLDEYNNFISENRLTNLEEISDKEILMNIISAMQEELELIKVDNICTENEYGEYQSQINLEIESYKNQIAIIETAEEQARLETERLAAEEAKRNEETDRLTQAEKDKAETDKQANNSSEKKPDNSNSESKHAYTKAELFAIKFSSYEEVERLIKEGRIRDYSWYESGDGIKCYEVGYYNYLSTGEIIDLRDPIFGRY